MTYLSVDGSSHDIAPEPSTFKPASHREPGLNVSPLRVSIPNFSIPPGVGNSEGSLYEAMYIQGRRTTSGMGNPSVGTSMACSRPPLAGLTDHSVLMQRYENSLASRLR